MQYFCQWCCAPIPADAVAQPCPRCGAVAAEWDATHSYTERLIQALCHPNAEARMGSIISLGNRGDPRAALPLARCALAHPSDVVQGIEIVRSLRKLPAGPEHAAALHLLLRHPARAVRRAVQWELDTAQIWVWRKHNE